MFTAPIKVVFQKCIFKWAPYTHTFVCNNTVAKYQSTCSQNFKICLFTTSQQRASKHCSWDKLSKPACEHRLLLVHIHVSAVAGQQSSHFTVQFSLPNQPEESEQSRSKIKKVAMFPATSMCIYIHVHVYGTLCCNKQHSQNTQLGPTLPH